MDYGLPPGSYNQPVSSFGTGYEEHLVAWFYQLYLYIK